ncbi:MAG: hypothetical protein IJJ44_07625 [Solobacterium sp.]|nr:hypothetical protein [Solobacterium sp.]
MPRNYEYIRFYVPEGTQDPFLALPYTRMKESAGLCLFPRGIAYLLSILFFLYL